MPDLVQQIAPYSPTYGVVEIARYPLLGGSFEPTWVLSVVGWTALFAIAAAVLFRRDTRRI
jgi:ABC-2 type transport system permease protein